jgi:hypothetical protein
VLDTKYIDSSKFEKLKKEFFMDEDFVIKNYNFFKNPEKSLEIEKKEFLKNIEKYFDRKYLNQQPKKTPAKKEDTPDELAQKRTRSASRYAQARPKKNISLKKGESLILPNESFEQDDAAEFFNQKYYETISQLG